MSQEDARAQRMAELEARRKRLEDLKQRKANGAASAPAATSSGADILNEISSLIDSKPATEAPVSSPEAAAPKPESTTAKPSVAEKLSRLSFHQCESVEIPSEEVIQYDRETQTDIEIPANDDVFTPLSPQHKSKHPMSPKGPKPLMSPKSQAAPAPAPPQPVALSDAERQQLLGSGAFSSFFSRASRVVERVLHANTSKRGDFDPFVDYVQDDDSNVDQVKGEELLTLRHSALCDESRVAHRPITSIDWSPKHDELVLCSYADRSQSVNSSEPDGVVLIWNLNMTTRPEFNFFCQSPVLCAMFHPTNPKLVIGGTYSGQLMLWDTREKHTPVQRSSLTQGHTHPVYSLSFPSASSSRSTVQQLVSVSTDGKVCTWNADLLVEPTGEYDVRDDKEEIAATCLGFFGSSGSAGPLGGLLLGSDDGKIYKARVQDQQAQVFESLRSHDAPLTAIDCHPVAASKSRDKSDESESSSSAYGVVGAAAQVSDLFLTSSCDWSCKLWSSKCTRPLLKFDVAQDYIYDIKWSPAHPAVFASVDGSGFMDVWNLSRDTELPAMRQRVSDTTALSKCKWSRDGHHLAAGDSDGRLHIYEAAPSLYESSQDQSMHFFEVMHKARAEATAAAAAEKASRVAR